MKDKKKKKMWLPVVKFNSCLLHTVRGKQKVKVMQD